MNAFDTGITGALALFAPRRMGKTEFVLADLAVEAELRGYQVCYCSFWNLQDNPAKALHLALEEMNKDRNWQENWTKFRDSVNSEIAASIGGASFKLKSQKSEKATDDDLIAIITLFKKLARQKKPTLLLLDEVQHLSHDRYGSLVATMRTQLDEHRKKIHVVYTGSSRDGLQRMFRDRKAPMFHAAQQVDFPQLDSNFVAYMLSAFERASKRKISLSKSTHIFKRMNYNPALFHHLLRHMVIKGIWDIEKGYENFLLLVDVDADYKAVWDNLKPIDIVVLSFLVEHSKIGIYSDEARGYVGNELGTDEVAVKTIQNSVQRLRDNQILYSPSRGVWSFEDVQFENWIRNQMMD